jgi:hypothetical protein
VSQKSRHRGLLDYADVIGFVRQIGSPRVIDTRPDTGSKKDVQQFISLGQIPSAEFGQPVSPRHIFLFGKQRRTH